MEQRGHHSVCWPLVVVSLVLHFSQLLKLGSCLLENGRHYLAASRAFIVGICDLAHLGPPEPMMAVCDNSEPGVWLLRSRGLGYRDAVEEEG